MCISSFGLMALGLALGQAPRAAPTEAEVRTEARTLMNSLCGDQCDVIDVRIKTRPAAPAAGVAPGFDDVPRAQDVPSEVALTLLFDSALDKPYRRFVQERVQQRVGELGLPVTVTNQVRAFPAPPPEPTTEPRAPPPPTSPPVIIPPPPAAPARAEAPPRAALADVFWRQMILFLPILLLFLLLAWLVFRLVRRLEDFAFTALSPVEPGRGAADVTLTPQIIEAPTRSATPLPPPLQDDLRADLERHRGSTRRVFRRLLLAGEYDTVARAVAILGDFVVRDLSHDPDVKRALVEAGRRTAATLRSPMTDEARDDLLRGVHAELVADRVAYRSSDVHPDFENLLGWSPEAFAVTLERLDARSRLVLLRHAPGHLTQRYLKGLSPDERAACVRSVLEAPPTAAGEVEALAQALEAQNDDAVLGGYEADHVINVLDALPAAEQETALTSLAAARPDFLRRSALPLESALLKVPDEAVAAAWGKVSVDAWVSYLRGAPEAIRRRALDLCPARLRSTVEDELSLRVPVNTSAATAARRDIVQAALDAAPS